MDAHMVSDGDVMLDGGQSADAHMITDNVALPDIGFVSGLKVVSDAVSGVYHRVGANQGIAADHCDRIFQGLSGRGDSEDAVVLDDGVGADADSVENLREHGRKAGVLE